MADLIEYNSNTKLVDQLLQITAYFQRQPNLSLWIKFLKVNGFLGSLGNTLGGFSVFLFQPGCSYVTVAEEQHRFNLMAKIEGDNKEYSKLLGSSHYSESKTVKDAGIMLEPTTNIAQVLVGDEECIATMGYALAVALMK